MRQFIIQAPDGRLLGVPNQPATGEPRFAETLAAARTDLTVAGYTIAFEVIDGTFQIEPLPDGLPQYTMMSYLLARHGEELLDWIKSTGIMPAHGGGKVPELRRPPQIKKNAGLK